MNTVLPDNILRRMVPEDRQRLGKAGLTCAEANARQERRNERLLQNQVANYLRLQGVPFFRQRMDRKATGVLGTPDFLFCLKGRFCAIECKVGNGRLTNEQTDQLRRIHEAGGVAIVARRLDDVTRLLSLFAT